jgi:hypothetical protein
MVGAPAAAAAAAAAAGSQPAPELLALCAPPPLPADNVCNPEGASVEDKEQAAVQAAAAAVAAKRPAKRRRTGKGLETMVKAEEEGGEASSSAAAAAKGKGPKGGARANGGAEGSSAAAAAGGSSAAAAAAAAAANAAPDAAALQWRVNFDEFNRRFRHAACVAMVAEKLDRCGGALPPGGPLLSSTQGRPPNPSPFPPPHHLGVRGWVGGCPAAHASARGLCWLPALQQLLRSRPPQGGCALRTPAPPAVSVQQSRPHGRMAPSGPPTNALPQPRPALLCWAGAGAAAGAERWCWC